jgi:hypothetical protein
MLSPPSIQFCLLLVGQDCVGLTFGIGEAIPPLRLFKGVVGAHVSTSEQLVGAARESGQRQIALDDVRGR